MTEVKLELYFIGLGTLSKSNGSGDKNQYQDIKSIIKPSAIFRLR